MPVPGHAGVAFTIDDQAYIANLISDLEDDRRDIFLQYDSSMNIWIELDDVPFIFPNSRNSAVSHNGNGYILNVARSFRDGVLKDSTEVLRFDRNGNWQKLPSIDLIFNDAVSVVIDNSIYITTGRELFGLVKYNLDDYSYIYTCIPDQILRSEAVGYADENDIIIVGGLEDNPSQDIFKSLNSVYRIRL